VRALQTRVTTVRRRRAGRRLLPGRRRRRPARSLHAGTPPTGPEVRQEWYQAQAEDVYKALSTTATRSVPYGNFTSVLRTMETKALQPGVRDHKYHARGIGTISELTVHGGNERLNLVDVLH
jgi:hypothetical protein